MKKKVLIVEDDVNISELIAIHLRDLEFEVDFAYDGQDGLMKGSNGNYQIIILDIMLPHKNGLEVCRELRMKDINTPILMLTSKSEEIDKVVGLEMGADDYLTKPFSVRELVARIKAILRRTEKQVVGAGENEEIKVGGLVINRTKRFTSLDGERIELSPKEFDLLHLLSSNPGATYSREQLLNEVWGYEFSGYEHTVNSHINRLRAKIENDMNKPTYILTTWGVGYRFSENI
ncbi:MAG: response regulator transcription factor [Schleiferiaceae bacterium]|jgi:DNA-binding response OmpR family regulator|nr:response regulator transcription factor [Schleiferiaceae bacterium]